MNFGIAQIPQTKGMNQYVDLYDTEQQRDTAFNELKALCEKAGLNTLLIKFTVTQKTFTENRTVRQPDEFETWIANALGTTPGDFTYTLSKSPTLLRYKDKLLDFTYMILGAENFDDYFTKEEADDIEVARVMTSNVSEIVIYHNIHKIRW